MQDIFLSLAIWTASIALIAFVTVMLQKKCSSVKAVSPARRITIVAVSSALAAVLMYFEIPLFFAPGFYKIDLSEIPVLICSFYLGPTAGLISQGLKIMLKLLLKGTSTAFVGDYANFLIGVSFVLPASFLYHFRKSKKTAVWGLLAGGAVMTVVGSLINAYYLIPAYSRLFGMSLESIVAMGHAVNARINSITSLILWAVVPFNFLKALIDSLLTLILYKRIEKVFFHS